MIKEKFLWWLLPLFVLVSGNFSPLRIGPILPIYWLFFIYAVSKRKVITGYFSKSSLSIMGLVVFGSIAIVIATYTVISQQIVGNEFEGALHPIAYSLLAVCRYIFILLILILLCRGGVTNNRSWWNALFLGYFLILVPLYLQVILHKFFNFEIGYIFPVETGFRYGGLIGEPQTISAWLCCFFFCLVSDVRYYAKSSLKTFLYVSIVISLILTQSTSWIMAFSLFVLLRARLWLIFSVVFGLVISGISAQILDKIFAEMFVISERSITLAGGYELFSKSPLNIIFGYGAGLTPYLLPSTDIFHQYPVFNLSDLGRQTIMNTYLEVIFEMGLIGAFLYFYLLFRAVQISSPKQFLCLAPILIGVFGISGGFGSGYFIVCIPILLALSKSEPSIVTSHLRE